MVVAGCCLLLSASSHFYVSSVDFPVYSFTAPAPCFTLLHHPSRHPRRRPGPPPTVRPYTLHGQGCESRVSAGWPIFKRRPCAPWRPCHYFIFLFIFFFFFFTRTQFRQKLFFFYTLMNFYKIAH